MNLHKEGMVNILNSNNIYFIICAITWGVMTVSVNYAQKRINPYIFICLCYLFTMIISFPFTNLGELNTSNTSAVPTISSLIIGSRSPVILDLTSSSNS